MTVSKSDHRPVHLQHGGVGFRHGHRGLRVGLQQSLHNDDDLSSFASTSAVELHVSSGTGYVIVVDGYYFYSEGSYVLNINPVGL